MTDSYPLRVRENILPLSISKTLPEAFKEWSFTENTIDHGEPIETCRLCDKEELRYHFEIENSFTRKTLLVGSRCILKFGVSVFDDGQQLSPKLAKKKLARLAQQMRLESCIKALERLAQTESNEILQNALDYYKKTNISPRNLPSLFFGVFKATKSTTLLRSLK